ncbi:hypothetical protein BH09VER1_BH09VER1_24010 [soil metagenome]
MKKIHSLFLAITGLSFAGAQAATQFYTTDGASHTLTNSVWGASSAGPFTSAFTVGNTIDFSVSSTMTNVTNTAVGGLTVENNATLNWGAAGTFSTGGTVATFDIGDNATLNWNAQNISTTAGTGITKTGNGTWNMGAQGNLFLGGFTLSGGIVIATGNNAVGGGALTFNSGTFNSTGTRVFAPTSIAIGGDFGLAGTGNAQFSATSVALGSATRIIENATTSGSRQFVGIISGGAGAGLTFTGTGAAQIYIGNTANSFSGPVTIKSGEVVFNDNGAFGNSTSIVLDGGRLTMASMAANGNTSALTAATIDSGRGISIGDTAGTSISIQSATGTTTYNGVISDVLGKTGSWAKQGAGTFVLGGASTYTGTTAINNGIVKLAGGNDRLPTGTVVTIGQANSTNVGTLDLNGQNQTIASLVSTTGSAISGSNTVTSASAATLTISGTSSNVYGDSTAGNTGVITGAISVVKAGSGTQTFGGVNAYTGSTTINAGSLVLSGSGKIGSGNLVLGGGTLDLGSITGSTYSLTSTQSVTGAGTIKGSSGKSLAVAGNFAPGNSPGTITLDTINLTLSGTSNFQITNTSLGAGTYDLVAGTVGGGTESVTFGGVLNVDLSGGTYGSFSLKLFDVDSYAGSFASLNTTGLSGGQSASFDSSTGIFTVVPEPSTYALLFASSGLMFWVIRRKRIQTA